MGGPVMHAAGCSSRWRKDRVRACAGNEAACWAASRAEGNSAGTHPEPSRSCSRIIACAAGRQQHRCHGGAAEVRNCCLVLLETAAASGQGAPTGGTASRSHRTLEPHHLHRLQAEVEATQRQRPLQLNHVQRAAAVGVYFGEPAVREGRRRLRLLVARERQQWRRRQQQRRRCHAIDDIIVRAPGQPRGAGLP